MTAQVVAEAYDAEVRVFRCFTADGDSTRCWRTSYYDCTVEFRPSGWTELHDYHVVTGNYGDRYEVPVLYSEDDVLIEDIWSHLPPEES